MKRIAIPASILLALCLSCGEGVSASDITDKAKGAVEQGKDAVAKGVDAFKDMDLSKLGPDQIKAAAGEMMASFTSKLGDIKDKATAENVSEMLAPIADKLVKAKDLLKDKMPSMDGLKSAVDGLKEKFSGDSGVMDALKPLMDKLSELMK